VSPSESDLRAALRAGEGDSLDPDSVLSAARAARHQRRVRIASAAGAAVVVAAIGGGLGVVNLRSSGSPTAGGAAVSSSRSPSGSQRLLYGSGLPASAPPAMSTPSCPATPAAYAVPGGGGTGQFGGTSALFDQPVAAMRVCIYPSAVGASARSVVLRGVDAQRVATSLNEAPTSLRGRMCPDLMPQNQLTFEFLAVSAAGHTLHPVTAEPGCRGRSTNGTAVRFSWSPPASMSNLLGAAATH
jgi:hypothetical protein